MTYELLEKANEVYSKIDKMVEIIGLFTTNSIFCDDSLEVTLSRSGGADNITIPTELADKICELCREERRKLLEEFDNL